MKERIYVRDVVDRDNRGLVSHAVLHCITPKAMGAIKGEGDERYVEAELKLNGVPVSFKGFFTELDTQTDRLIKKAARDMVLDKLSDLDETLYQVGQVVKDKMRERLGIEVSEWD